MRAGVVVNDTPMVHGDPFAADNSAFVEQLGPEEREAVRRLLIQPVIDPPTEMADLAKLS
jgi:hypothetical protein